MKTKKVKVSEIKFGPIRNEVLPDGFIAKVQKYKEVLSEVETTSLELTISNFQRDLNPEKELAIWQIIAEQYQIAIEKNPNWSLEEKTKYFEELLFSTMR